MKNKKLKRFLFVIVLIAVGLSAYIKIINKNTNDMTVRQKALKAFYPVLMGFTKLKGSNSTIIKNEKNIAPQPPNQWQFVRR